MYIRKVSYEFKLSQHPVLETLKPFYGLSKSEDLWYETLDRHYKTKLNMERLRRGHVLFIKYEDGSLFGRSSKYADDII